MLQCNGTMLRSARYECTCVIGRCFTTGVYGSDAITGFAWWLASCAVVIGGVSPSRVPSLSAYDVCMFIMACTV